MVLDGAPDLGDGPLASRLAVFRERFDRFRSAVVTEPRGSDVVVGALLCEPSDPTCAAGVIFFNNVAYLGMCGHGTIGLVATLAHLGRIDAGAHRIETPVGIVTAYLHEDGRVTVDNVPSYRHAKGVSVAVVSHGRVTGDVAWGGNWFFLCDDHGQDLQFARVEGLTDFAWRIRQALERDGVTGADGAAVRAGAVVLATGARAVDLAPELPIRAKKGHLAITDRYPGVVRHQLVELGYVTSAHAASGDSVAFNVQPRPTGQLLVGSSRQFDAPASAVDQRILARMLARALDYLPGLAPLSCLRVWTGVRAATPDGLPLIGPHPDRPGVWLATGHEGLGIATAPATAALLAAQMLGQSAELPLAPYLPARLLGEAPLTYA